MGPSRFARSALAACRAAQEMGIGGNAPDGGGGPPGCPRNETRHATVFLQSKHKPILNKLGLSCTTEEGALAASRSQCYIKLYAHCPEQLFSLNPSRFQERRVININGVMCLLSRSGHVGVVVGLHLSHLTAYWSSFLRDYLNSILDEMARYIK